LTIKDHYLSDYGYDVNTLRQKKRSGYYAQFSLPILCDDYIALQNRNLITADKGGM